MALSTNYTLSEYKTSERDYEKANKEKWGGEIKRKQRWVKDITLMWLKHYSNATFSKFFHSVSRSGSISLCGKWLLTVKLPSSNQKRGAVGARLSFPLWLARWPPAYWHRDKPWFGLVRWISWITADPQRPLKASPYGESAFLFNTVLRMWSGQLWGCLVTSINHMHTAHWNVSYMYYFMP